MKKLLVIVVIMVYSVLSLAEARAYKNDNITYKISNHKDEYPGGEDDVKVSMSYDFDKNGSLDSNKIIPELEQNNSDKFNEFSIFKK